MKDERNPTGQPEPPPDDEKLPGEHSRNPYTKPLAIVITLSALATCGLAFISLFCLPENSSPPAMQFFLTTLLALFVLDAIVFQILVSNNQWIVMQDQGNAMRDQLAEMEATRVQADEMFYAANRAYLGIKGLGIETETVGNHQLPEGGHFRVVMDLINKGRTPAERVNYSLQGGFVSCPIPALDRPFLEHSPELEIRELLPDQHPPMNVRSDVLFCTSDQYEGAVDKRLAFVFGIKLSYFCLGNHAESFTTYYIWNYHEQKFTFRNQWPVGYVPGPHPAGENPTQPNK